MNKNKSKRYIELRGSPAGIKKAKEDLPKHRIVEYDFKGGRIVLKNDKHQLHVKVAHNFNLNWKYITDIN